MEIRNRIKEGVHLDNAIYEQPENTMSDSLNGIITDEGSGLYSWRNLKGNTLSFTLLANDWYFTHCLIRDRLFVIALNSTETQLRFYEVTFSGNVGTANVRYTVSNTGFNYSRNFPIRAIWGFYESVNVQRIYLTDNNNPPRCFNVGSGTSFSISEKFSRFSPVINHVYGNIELLYLSNGGTLKAGTYFFALRYYTEDGYYTDWSQLSNPIMAHGNSTGSTYNSYQSFEGKAPNENTGKQMTLNITNIDKDYSNIMVCAFYSNDYNTSEPGVIIYDGKINNVDNKAIIFKGNENFGTVPITELVETTITIDKCKDMLYAKKKNVISNIKEREEIDISALNPESKNTYLPATIQQFKYRILMDTTGYPGQLTGINQDKGLFGVKSSENEVAGHYLRKGLWYKALTQVHWHDGGTTYTENIGTVFFIPTTTTSPTWDSGNYIPAIVKKKYRRAGLTPTGDATYDANNVYVCEVKTLEGEYLDYKSPKISANLKGYPHGEKIRLGILFFDKTGRPFFVRYLKDTTEGDVTILKRSYANPLLELLNPTTDAYGTIYSQVNGLATGLKVSGIDITGLEDKIGGFMIVRCPIVHQYLSMGIVTPTYLTGNDVYAYPRFTALQSGAKNMPGCYDFTCPEDMFKLKNFSIQPKDELENLFYLESFRGEEIFVINSRNYAGFGRREMSYGYTFYHKFYIHTNHNHVTNGSPGAIHEIISVTPYELGDQDVPINPLDLTKLYKNTVAGWDITYIHTGYTGTHSVVILDINEAGASYDLKGSDTSETHPYALLCALKRANADPYGGNSDSSLANSLYLATGHFQEINTTVLNQVLSNGRYIFNDIEVFGGDTFLSFFDYKRTWYNDDGGESHQISQGVILPVESRINLGLREGAHLAKTRTFEPSYNITGLRMKVGSMKLEDYNYNDGYSSDDISDYYLPVPFNYNMLSNFDVRIRYSTEKNYGENQDKFRTFLPNDYIDLDSNQGPITNIKYKQDRLVYWQPDEIGYIPINERALTQNSIGQPVQLGIGGLFERYDQMIEKIGNSNQFGLIESAMGYHWYDAKRKIFLNMDLSLKLSPESIMKGLDKFFKQIPVTFVNSDNPMFGYGCHGGYDPMSRIVFYTFAIDAVTNYTIAINSTLDKFCGFYNFYPKAYITVVDKLLELNDSRTSFYHHGSNINYGNFFGVQKISSLTFIVKEESNAAKFFDTFGMIGNTNIFTRIKYENSLQSIIEDVASYNGSGVYTILNRNYEFRNKRWFGNFPKVSRERLLDGYLKITLYMDSPYPVEFYEMLSNVRKAF